MLQCSSRHAFSIDCLQSSASSQICQLLNGQLFAAFSSVSVNEWGASEPLATAEFNRQLTENVKAAGEIRDQQLLSSIAVNSFRQYSSMCSALDTRWITCNVSCAIIDQAGAIGVFGGDGAYLWCSESRVLLPSVESGTDLPMGSECPAYELLRNAWYRDSTEPLSSFEIKWDLRFPFNLLFLSDQTVCKTVRALGDFARFYEEIPETSIGRSFPGIVIHA